MQKKNLTPFLVGTKVTSTSPPKPIMAVIVRASYAIVPGAPLEPIEKLVDQRPLSEDAFAEDDDARAGALLYPSDFADFKLNAEVMLKGACHTPGGKPLTECPVKLSVGAWSKALVVVGRRVWTEKIMGAAVSDPHPFTEMPIDWPHAFGGPEHAANPVGLGRGTAELPNVELATARVRGKGDRPPPAGFGPVNAVWPPRAGKVGKEYGRVWKRDRAPYYAVDFDWTHFHAAPADQQLQGYLRGDEDVSFVNLHPEASSFSVRLPSLRVRVFVKDDAGAVREPAMKLDTLFADLDAGQLLLTWRGLVEVREDDLADVKTMLVASESLADAPLPPAHYHAILEAFEADPLEADKHVPGGRKALDALKLSLADDAAHPERSEKERGHALLDGVDTSGLPPDQQSLVAGAVAAGKAEIDKFGPTPNPPAGGAAPAQRLSSLVEQAKGLVKQLRGLAAKEKLPLDDVDKLEALLDDPATKRALKSAETPQPEEIHPGADLAERNLAGMDLAGRDLSGANLSGAVLAGAKLAGATLARANLKQAIVAKADLSGADLSGADLTQANFTGATLTGANLANARIEQTLFVEAKLCGAALDAVTGNMTVLSGADLTAARFVGCDLGKPLFESSVLERADFTRARLVQGTLTRCKAAEITLTKAELVKTTLMQSDLRGARVAEARGDQTSWIGCELQGADFRATVFPNAHFMNASADGATFHGADLRQAGFYRARLARTSFERANLFGANFGKAELSGARFVDANLYDARFLGAAGKGCDFRGANLARAILPS